MTHFRCCCVVVVVGRNRWFGCSRLRWRFERCRRGSPRDSEALRGAGWTMANWKRTTVTDAHCLLHSIIFVSDDIAAFDSSRFISLAAAPHDTSMILKMIYIAPTWWWTCPRSQETRQVRGQFLLTERPLSKFHSLSEKTKKKKKKKKKKKHLKTMAGQRTKRYFTYGTIITLSNCPFCWVRLFDVLFLLQFPVDVPMLIECLSCDRQRRRAGHCKTDGSEWWCPFRGEHLFIQLSGSVHSSTGGMASDHTIHSLISRCQMNWWLEWNRLGCRSFVSFSNRAVSVSSSSSLRALRPALSTGRKPSCINTPTRPVLITDFDRKTTTKKKKKKRKRKRKTNNHKIKDSIELDWGILLHTTLEFARRATTMRNAVAIFTRKKRALQTQLEQQQ